MERKRFLALFLTLVMLVTSVTYNTLAFDEPDASLSTDVNQEVDLNHKIEFEKEEESEIIEEPSKLEPEEPVVDPEIQPEVPSKAPLNTLKAVSSLCVQDGWVQKGTAWFYCENGNPIKNWKEIGGYWYFFRPDGEMKSQAWHQSGDDWYYFSKSGSAVKNDWAQIGGVWYLFNSKSVMLKDQWTQSGGYSYYLGSDGKAAKSQWKKVGDVSYYFDSSSHLIRETSATHIYSVKKIMDDGSIATGKADFVSNNLNDAINKMNQLGSGYVVTSMAGMSHLGIVAMSSGYAHSLPNRKGEIKDLASSETLNIYSNRNLTGSALTYISSNYKMQYKGTELTDSGKPVIRVNIQGAEGYVDLSKVDLIPMHYIDKKIPIYLGGNLNDDGYRKVVSPDYYWVKNGEISLYFSQTYAQSGEQGITYAQAPSWLPESGNPYYSEDGVHFFSDKELKKPIMDGNQPGEFYAYYQWLPVRSFSNISADDLNARLRYLDKTDSIMFGNEQAFVESGHLYGMNPLLLFAQAAHESAYGTSWLAKNRFNLFGWNAVDSDPSQALTYTGVYNSINNHMAKQLSSYFDVGDWRNAGLSFGNKGSGITVRYASDPFYGIKVAGIAYTTDRAAGFKDYNGYSLARINNQTSTPVYKGANTHSGVYYATNSGLNHQVVLDLGDASGYMKTYLSMPVVNGSVSVKAMPVDLPANLGYIANSARVKIKSSGIKKSNAPSTRITVAETSKKYTVKQDLNMRSGWGTSNRVLATIPAKTVVQAYPTTNGWAKVVYNNQIGYVSQDYLTTESIPTAPKTGWVKDGAKWLYYENNTPVKGWREIGGSYYLFNNSTGVMYSSTWTKDAQGRWSYLGADGKALMNEWFKSSGKWYYAGNDGKMLRSGLHLVKGSWYEFGSDADMKANKWIKNSKGKWHYLNSGGAAVKNAWVKVSGKWYYADANSEMITGWKKINGSWYVFDSSTAMLSNQWYKNASGSWSYVSDSGAALTSQWKKSGGKWYYFLSHGGTARGVHRIGGSSYAFGTDSVMHANQWVKLNQKWYYATGSGALQKGWIKLDGSWYYLNPSDCVMVSDKTMTINGTRYRFDRSGRML